MGTVIFVVNWTIMEFVTSLSVSSQRYTITAFCVLSAIYMTVRRTEFIMP